MSLSSASSELIGHCLCDEIKVKIQRETLNDISNGTALCHCENCKRATGGLSSYNLILPEDKVVVLDSKSLMKQYDDTNTKSKNLVERYFCSQCGSPIYSKSSKLMPKKRIIKLSLFSGKIDQLPCPSIEVFCKDMMKWEKQIDGAKYYDESVE
ncbi:unnamed protein product [Adineta steineri]|nr:unnamed protein product [Adineta steineri]